MATANAAGLAARLDRLPMTRHIWVLVTLISLGGGFELYDLFLTAYIAPGLVKANFFTPESLGPFCILAPYGAAGVGTFVFALFAGLFVGSAVRPRRRLSAQFGRSQRGVRRHRLCDGDRDDHDRRLWPPQPWPRPRSDRALAKMGAVEGAFLVIDNIAK